MANRLKTLFFVLILSVSVFSGTPLQGGDMKMKEAVCPMKCCRKKAESPKPEKADDAKFLCRVLVCPQNMPTGGGSNAQTNFAPVIIASEKISLFEILFSTSPKEENEKSFGKINPLSHKPPPKYIRHRTILI